MVDRPIESNELIAAYRAVARPREAVRHELASQLRRRGRTRTPVWSAIALGVVVAAATVLLLSWASRSGVGLDSMPRDHERSQAPYASEPLRDDAPTEAIERTDPRTPEREPPAQAPEVSAAPSTAAPVVVPQRRAPTQGPRGAPEPAAPAVEADALPLEMALLQRARAHLQQRESAEALAVLEEHERRFPASGLVEERRALRIMALCSAPGRSDAARLARDAFLGEYPRTTYAERVRAACARIDAGD